jgi:hypothetical protein
VKDVREAEAPARMYAGFILIRSRRLRRCRPTVVCRSASAKPLRVGDGAVKVMTGFVEVELAGFRRSPNIGTPRLTPVLGDRGRCVIMVSRSGFG